MLYYYWLCFRNLIGLGKQSDYKKFIKRILKEGEWVVNERTGKRCLTIISHTFTYEGSDPAPVTTLRDVKYRSSIAEFLGYWQGLDDAQAFADLGARTWFANANKTKAWLANPVRKGENDLGFIYGRVAHQWPIISPDLKSVVGYLDLFKSVADNILKGNDTRGEIITFFNPGVFHLGALRPCMYEHQFSLIGNDLYLDVNQRSADGPLGVVFNRVQAYVSLHVMARITKKNPKRVNHHMVNCHIYEDQIPFMKELVSRKDIPLKPGQAVLTINPDIQTYDDIISRMTADDFSISEFPSHPAMKIPFSE